MIKATLDGQYKIEIPESWYDISFGFMINYQNNPSMKIEEVMKMIIKGLPKGNLLTNYYNELLFFWEGGKYGENEYKGLKSIISSPIPLDKLKPPKKLLGNKIPKDFNNLSTGQYQDCVIEISDIKPGDESNIDVILKKYHNIAAIVLQHTYDSNKTEEIKQKLLKEKAMDVLGVANFFLENLIESKSGILKDLRKASDLQSPKLKLDFTN